MESLPVNRHKIADVTDRFAIKNFVLSDSSTIPAGHSFEEPFMFNVFFFSICLKGKASFKVNFREFNVREGMIFTYLPGQIFSVTGRSDDFESENLFISSDYILQLPLPTDFDLLKRIGSEPVREAPPYMIENILELQSIIVKYHRRESSHHTDLQIKALMYALLMEIGNLYISLELRPIKAISRGEVLAESFFRLLIRNYKTERSVAFYADKLCLTPKYLSTTIKNITGHPVSEWTDQAVLIEAKRMLKTTDLTALQISEELNFPNPSFFGRFFKQHIGMTPLQYRKN